MNSAWSIFWRIFLLQLIATVPVVLAIQSSGLITDSAALIAWKPTLVYVFMVVVLLLIKLKVHNGALSKIWGHRISSNNAFWHLAHTTLVAMYTCLSVGNGIATYYLPQAQWGAYKMWVALACFVLVSVWLGQRLTNVPMAMPEKEAS